MFANEDPGLGLARVYLRKLSRKFNRKISLITLNVAQEKSVEHLIRHKSIKLHINKTLNNQVVFNS